MKIFVYNGKKLSNDIPYATYNHLSEFVKGGEFRYALCL